jgi:hypothetical protein
MKYIKACFWPVLLLSIAFIFTWVSENDPLMLHIASTLKNMDAGIIKTCGLVFYVILMIFNKYIFSVITFVGLTILAFRVNKCVKSTE